MALPGVFIVLEGADGSGKGTQFKLLTERLRAAGQDVEIFDFPRYDQPSSHFVKKYLNGDYGPAASISPYAASLFYALDRFEAAPQIKKALEEGKVVLANRYAGSNMGHQGSKFGRSSERRAFFMWADNLEYEVLGIPRPNLNIFLRVPADLAYQLVSQKAERQYTKAKRDEYEADINHLRESVATYDLLCQLFPKDFVAIECAPEGALLGIPQINDLIWQRLKDLLPPAKRKGAARTVELAETENVINKPSATKVAADNLQSARLSAYAWTELRLANPSLTVGQRRFSDDYYQIKRLPKELSTSYQEFLASNHQARQQLLAELKRLQTPKSKHNLQGAVISAAPLALLEEIAFDQTHVQTWPSIAELKQLANRKSRPAKVKDQSVVAEQFTAYDEGLKLVHSTYRNEFDALVDAEYNRSNLSYADLSESIAKTTYEEKLKRLRQALKNDRHLRQRLVYSFELVTDSLAIRNLLNSGAIIAAKAQPLSPRLGYGTPNIIEDSGLADSYGEIFDMSIAIYDDLYSHDPELAAYTVLFGHRNRFQIDCSIQSLLDARAYKGLGAEAKELLDSVIEKLSEINPTVGEFL